MAGTDFGFVKMNFNSNYLNFGQYRKSWGYDTYWHIEADEELVEHASLRLSVDVIAENSSREGQTIVQSCYQQQG